MTFSDYLADPERYLQLALDYGTDFLLSLILAALIFFIGRRVAKWVTNMLVIALQKKEVDVELVGFLQSLTYWALLAVVVIAALAQLGVQTASFVAVLGAAGLAIGLALQGSLSNFAAGVLILILRPFKVGHFVDVAGESGSVTNIRVFTTELRTSDNKCIIIPNSRVLESNIVNYTSTGRRRVDIVLEVDQQNDLTTVKQVLSDLVAADQRILPEPQALVVVHGLDRGRVQFAVRVWVKTSDYWPVYWQLIEQSKQAFDEQGISLPPAQLAVAEPTL